MGFIVSKPKPTSYTLENYPCDDFTKATKCLLLGTGESGKTTIFKQIKIIHNNGFTDEEINFMKDCIRNNVLTAIRTLVENCELMNIHYDMKKSYEYANFIKNFDVRKQNFDSTYVDIVKRLWFDTGVQNCYRRAHEFQLHDNSKYFLDKVDEIYMSDYNPSHQDILNSRIETKTLNKVEFEMKFPNGSKKFILYDIGGARNDRFKWIDVFDGIEVILFVISCSDFDLTLRENPEVNRFEESLKTFKAIWNNPCLTESGFIIFLNKQDILEKKIREGQSIGKVFTDYNQFETNELPPRLTDYQKEIEKTKIYIRSKLQKTTDKEISVRSINGEKSLLKRPFYYHYTIATDTENIRTVFFMSERIILNSMLKRHRPI